MDSKLFSEVVEGEKTVTGIEAFLIFSVTAFYLAVVAWSIGTNEFVTDPSLVAVTSNRVGRSRLLLEKRLVNSKPLSV